MLPIHLQLYRRRQRGLSGVTDYDVIVIGGQAYSANQILDKQLIASVPTKIYKGDLKTVIRTVPAGQPLGRVFSYLKASGYSGKNALMLYDNPAYTGTPYYILDETPVDTSFLKDQGTLTVSQEVKAEADANAKAADPVGYYFKKLIVPALLTGAAIYVAVSFGKEYIKDKVTK